MVVWRGRYTTFGTSAPGAGRSGQVARPNSPVTIISTQNVEDVLLQSALGSSANYFALTGFSEGRPRRSCLTMLQMFEQMLYQKPVHLVYPDPTAYALDEAGPRPRPEATVGDLELADVL